MMIEYVPGSTLNALPGGSCLSTHSAPEPPRSEAHHESGAEPGAAVCHAGLKFLSHGGSLPRVLPVLYAAWWLCSGGNGTSLALFGSTDHMKYEVARAAPLASTRSGGKVSLLSSHRAHMPGSTESGAPVAGTPRRRMRKTAEPSAPGASTTHSVIRVPSTSVCPSLRRMSSLWESTAGRHTQLASRSALYSASAPGRRPARAGDSSSVQTCLLAGAGDDCARRIFAARTKLLCARTCAA